MTGMLRTAILAAVLAFMPVLCAAYDTTPQAPTTDEMTGEAFVAVPPLDFSTLPDDIAPLPLWMQGEPGDGPMPPADKLLSGIMATLYDCEQSLLTLEYTCTFTSHGEDFQAVMKPAIEVKRLDNQAAPVVRVATGHNTVHCLPRKEVIGPLGRGFEDVCIVNDVPIGILFRMTMVGGRET